MEPKDYDQTPLTRPTEHERSMQVMTAGSLLEAIGGLTAVVLAILGLAGTWPLTMTSIGVIAIGAALLLGGGAMASRYSQFVSYARTDRGEAAEIGGGLGAEFLVGAAGLVLGVLALLNISPFVLCSVAIICYGGGLLLSTGATSAMNAIGEAAPTPFDRRARLAREAVQGAAAVQALVGVGAVILGILALLNIWPVTLMLVALLGLGGGVLLTGSAIGSRMMLGMRHHR